MLKFAIKINKLRDFGVRIYKCTCIDDFIKNFPIKKQFNFPYKSALQKNLASTSLTIVFHYIANV